MRKRYAILQKKLEELESELIQVFALPAETPCHQLLAEGIEHRFEFLNNLLSAEISSHPSRPHHHLIHIANRLDQLATAFRDWDDHRTSVVLNQFDAASTCSCTESCLNDDGDGEGSPDHVGSPVHEEPETFSPEMGCLVREGPETVYEPVVEEKSAVESVKVETEREEEGKVWFWRYCGVMAGGAVLGAVLMGLVMVRFSGCFHCRELEGSLVPT